jgi:glycosyltransferase involved in cell wall biosynthesis
MRAWDRRSVKWVDHFAAISTAVQERIGRYYEREACVIHPPVDTSFYTPVHSDDVSEEPSGLPGGPFVLTCSRFIPYKRLDLAIRAADRVGLPIVVAGHGPGEAALRHVAEQVRVPVIFEVSPSNERLRTLYRMASTFAFPALEDFGIVAVEAQACGTPVVGIAAGGSLDTIADGVSGVLAANQDEVALADALSRSLSLDPQACVDHASNFSHSEFGRRIQAWVTGNDSTDAGRTVDHLEAECPSL